MPIYLICAQDSKNSPSTVNKAIGIVKVILRKVLYREEINRGPIEGVGRIKEKRRNMESLPAKTSRHSSQTMDMVHGRIFTSIPVSTSLL